MTQNLNDRTEKKARDAVKGQIFVSYSRRDKDFVRHLVDALSAAERAVWVDWEDIPPTADWLQEIYKGIEESDTFVAVISPDSVASKVVRQELEHALDMNKRLVPILYREVDNQTRDTMHPALSAHNWIIMVDESQFDAQFQTVLAAIDTDLSHVRTHTRLLVRAREWDQKARNPSLLLRGEDLREATDWMDSSESKDPAPSELHEQYIYASRRAQRTRRTAFTAFTFYAITVAFLLIFALTQYIRAEEQRQVAVDNAELARQQEIIARGLSLAGNSLVALGNSNTDLALAMAIEATELDTDRTEVEFALAEAAYTPGTRILLDDHQTTVTAVTYGIDNSVAYSGDIDGNIIVWDTNRGEQIGTLDHHTAHISSLTMTEGGNALLTTSFDGTAALINVGVQDDGSYTHQLSRQWNAHGYAVYGAATVPNTNLVVTIGCEVLGSILEIGRGFPICQTAGIRIWDLSTLQSEDSGLLYTLEAETSEVTAVAVSPSGEYIAVAYANAPFVANTTGISLWSLAEGAPILVGNLSGHSDVVSDLAFSTDSQRLVSASQDGRLILWNAITQEEIARMDGHTDWVMAVDFSPDGRRIVSASADNTLMLWSFNGERLNRFFGHEAWVLDVSFSPDSQNVLSAPGNLFLDPADTALRVWDINNGAQIARWVPPQTALGSVTSIAISPDANLAVTGSISGTVTLWDAGTGTALETWAAHDSGIQQVTFNRDGSLIATVSASQTEGQLAVWRVLTATPDPESGESMIDEVGRSFFPNQRGLQTVAFSPVDDTIAIGGRGGSFYRVTLDPDNPGDMRLLTTYSGFSGDVRGLDYTADGTRLMSVTGGFNGTVDVWPVPPSPGPGEDGPTITQPVARLSGGHGDSRLGATISADGQRVLSAGYDNRVILWDVPNERLLRVYTGHTGPVNFVAFHPDELTFVSGSTDGTVRVWTVGEGKEIRRFDGHERPINEVAYDPGGDKALSASADGTIRVWHVHTLDALLEWTRNNRYIRDLTCNEREIYGVPPLCSTEDADGSSTN